MDQPVLGERYPNQVVDSTALGFFSLSNPLGH